jgi:hypothetical protein
VKNLEILEDGDTSTDEEIKNGFRPKLKWITTKHQNETFAFVPFISYSMVGSLGCLFLQVERALGEVRKTFSQPPTGYDVLAAIYDCR